MYLIYEAKKAGLSKWDYLKIVGLQAADFFIGSVPIVGDIADFVIKANKASIPMFKDHVEELVNEARAAGVSEEAIAKLSVSADKLPQLVDHAIAVHKKVKKGIDSGPQASVRRVPAQRREFGPRHNEKLVSFFPHESRRVIAIGTATEGQAQRILDSEMLN